MARLEFCAVDLQVKLETDEFAVPFIHKVEKIVIREFVNVGVDKINPLVHLMAVAKSLSNSALYVWTRRVDLQCNFLAAQWTILENLVPMIEEDVKSSMKHL
jgi:hypothetical protein